VQVLLALEGYITLRPRCLDPAAGSGAWCRSMRAVYPGCYIVAVEPRESERANLEAAADEVFIGTFEEYLATNPEPFDIIAGNPPFARVLRALLAGDGPPKHSLLQAREAR
jgi:methylase of polypeptide subunit release factors